ncbi:MAG: ABC transporter ATP-binding protein [Alphaproteobacteria bacterium]
MANTLKLKVYQKKPIALNAELSCKSGELLALVGPSGSGKTTLLRTIAGLYTPKEAQIHCGNDIWLDTSKKINFPTHLRSVGMVFQSYALFPHMNVLENITAAMRHLPKSEWHNKVLKLLDMLHLSGLEERRPSQLSGGQKQRVGIARALARDPKILLFDEPFSAIDKASRHGLYQEIMNLHENLSIPIIMVTHDFDEASMLGDKMSFIHEGNIIQTDTPYNVFTRPANVEMARLLNIKNIFEGEILYHKEDATYIKWHNNVLKAAFYPHFEAQEKIYFAMPSTEIILHRDDIPDVFETPQNTLNGKVLQLINLSESIMVTVAVNDSCDTVSMTVPAHFVKRTKLQKGSSIKISLLSDGIHLMKKA